MREFGRGEPDSNLGNFVRSLRIRPDHQQNSDNFVPVTIGWRYDFQEQRPKYEQQYIFRQNSGGKIYVECCTWDTTKNSPGFLEEIPEKKWEKHGIE